jgi:integrase
MFRALRFSTDAGAYWSVVDDRTYETVVVADTFLQYFRLGRGRAESTTRKYAEAIALYHSYCATRCTDWAAPDISAFQMWLRVAPPLRRLPRANPAPDGAAPVRSNGQINLISYVVCEMFKYAAAQSLWPSDKLGLLFETTQVRISSGDRRHVTTSTVTRRRRHRHRLRSRPTRRRDAPVDVLKTLMGVCQNSRDQFLLGALATTGLRRGEVLGLRLSDLHLLPSSAMLGCQEEGPHLHVVPRHNSNSARVKNGKHRVAPVTRGFVTLYETYRADRDDSSPAALSGDSAGLPMPEKS